MKTWDFIVQVNGLEETNYCQVAVPVSDEEYTELTKGVEECVPLCKLPVFKAISSRIDDYIDWESFVDDEDEKPIREDYDDEDEFEDDYSEWEEAHQEALDEYCIDSINIVDPGDMVRFLQAVKELRFPEWASESYTWECDWEENRIVTYSITFKVDESGIVTEISSMTADGLECDGLKGGRYGNCYPDYDFLVKQLKKVSEEQCCE